MKQTMTDYINALSENSLETLEQIVSSQYRKFVRFYKLVAKHSSNITGVKYQFEKKSSLDIILIIKGKNNVDKVKTEIEADIEKSDYKGIVKVDGKNIFLSIYLEEE